MSYPKQPILYLLFAFLTSIVYGKSPSGNGPGMQGRKYISTAGEGRIGVTAANPIDNPADNIFHIYVSEQLKGGEQVYLVYDLDGVKDHTGVARSINDQLATGGYFVKKSNGWARQRERISASWLKQGDNIIRFTLPEGAAYAYRVKHVALEVGPARTNDGWIVVDQPSLYNDKAYIKGFVKGVTKERLRIKIGGTEARVWNGAFEAIVDHSSASGERWSADISVIYPNGATRNKKIWFTHKDEPDYRYRLVNAVAFTQKTFSPRSAGTVTLAGASLFIDSKALKATTPISITALRAVDLPALDAGMVNVTEHSDGYRFLPHGTTFRSAAGLSLDYDETKIPEGYTAKDIRTYYFDEHVHHWIALPLDTVMEQAGKVISRTTHFTDMINAVIRVPESPEVQGFSPTSMKGIKAADPTSAVSLVSPPQANSMGTASLGYPIEVPAGRAGMQPQISISYNSGSGNGWLGLGWNLSTPSIGIDTRWGVPRYDDQKETETYLFNGEQLSPVAHRGELVSRTPEKQFHPRVEGSFNKVVRHGSSPKNYWWDVTDKSGTHSFYGGDPATGADPSATLGDAAGNISHWALKETRDLNGNFVRYHYARVNDNGLPNGTVNGYQLYVTSITYTGHNGTEGKYAVIFKRDRDIDGKTGRKDITIAAQNGFKQVTADLLKRIDVQFEGKNVRHYELQYKEGAFYKSLLAGITQYDAQDNLFNKHEFDYYNDIGAGNALKPFSAAESWTAGSDNVHGSMLTHLQGFTDEASALSGTASKDLSISVTVCVGFGVDVTTKLNSVGGSFSYTKSESQGLLSMIDVNGDGLQDKLFLDRARNALVYRPNLSGTTGAKGFGEKVDIDGISVFQKENTKTVNGGIEANAFGGLMAGANTGRSTSTTTIYFTEANGDQLPDIVKDGVVYFNHIDTATGKITFTATSEGTPSRIFAGMKISEDIVDRDALERERQQAIDENPLHDIVRMWRAPYSGVINVTAPVQLLPSNDPERAGSNADGVKVMIQLKDHELWSERIGADDYSVHTPSGTTSLSVQKDDRIYFRINSVDNGSYDSVKWSPLVEYITPDAALTDANKKPLYRFGSEKDFVFTSSQTISTPINGHIRIDGKIVKPVTTDDMLFVILRSNNTTTDTIWQARYKWDTAVSTDLLLENITARQNEQYRFKAIASTNVNWTAIQWRPHVVYTGADDPQIDLAKTTIETYATPEYSLFAYTTQISRPLKVGSSKDTARTVTFEPVMHFRDPSLLEPPFTGAVTFSVKKRDTLLGKTTLYVNNGVLLPASITVNAADGDELFVEYHIIDNHLASGITAADAVATGAVDTTIAAGVHTSLPKNGREEDVIFGHLYRGWGEFAWNGNRDFANQPINESLLKPSDQIQQKKNVDVDGLSQRNGDQLNTSDAYDPKQDRFIILIADARQQRWNGYDQYVFLNGTVMSSSRMGDDDLSVLQINSGEGAGTGTSAIDKISKVTSYSFTAGASAGFAGVSGSVSTASSKILTDYMDMNGDRYPDVVTEKIIQYTDARGGLSNKTIPSGGQIQETSSRTTALSLTGSASIPTAIFKRGAKDNQQVSTDAGSAQTTAGSAGITGSGNLSAAQGTNRSEFAWMDVNGDGLPDRINQSTRKVALNLGYAFTAEEDWGLDEIQSSGSKTTSGGAGLGVMIGNNSFALGFSLARSDNFSDKTLLDVNGDGLADLVSSGSSGGALKVRLNTGNGFSSDVLTWTGATLLSNNNSASESGNIAFTVGFSIFGVKFTITPSVNASNGMSRETSRLADMDGDGYPDYVLSSKDDQLTISRSTIGRTNLLSTVKRPLGALILLDYQRIGNTYNMPNNVWALSSVKIFDGFKGDGADTLMTTFTYEDGYFDRNEREFYGFGKLNSQVRNTQQGNAIHSAIVQTFHNRDFYRKGALVTESFQDAGSKKFTEKENIYQLKDIETGNVLPASFTTNDADAAFLALLETRQRFYEGQSQPGKSTHTTFGYDTKGNITNYTDFGDEGDDDDLSATIAYHNITDKYIVSAPKSIVVTGSGKTYRKRESVIDGQTGDVKQIRQYADESNVSVQDMEYDDYGSLVKTTRPANAKGQRLSTSFTYDGTVHTYVTGVTNSYGYSSTATYDLRFGQLLNSKDMNGNSISYEIDDLGRITKIISPYEKSTGNGYTIQFEYHPDAAVPWALTRHYDPANPKNDLQTVTFTDGLGRVLQTKKDAAVFQGNGAADKEQMIVSGRTLYDGLGRAIAAYYPIIENTGNAGVINKTFDNVNPTLTTYDVMDRVIAMTLPDGSVTTTVYGFGNDRSSKTQFSTKTKDPNGKQMEDFADVRGRITAVKNYTSKGDVWTSFRYDAINEQVEATDDQGNTTVSAYDMLGRRISRKHPDAGLTSYSYDAVGNTIRLSTANLQKDSSAITYDYDFERLTAITYPQNPENNVHYTYGAAGAPFNRAGKIVVQEDGSGAEEFFYGLLGETIKLVRTIVIPNHDEQTYITEWTYDTWNRLSSMTYPDGEKLTYTYNAGGLLQSMSGKKQNDTYNYVTQLGYDKFEQRVFMAYGNGTRTSYSYEPDRRRLKGMVAKTAAGRAIIDNVYEYDKVNNILSLTNNAPIPANNLMGGPASYTYEYDDLYRLTTANGQFARSNETQRYTLKMDYNNVGGIVEKAQQHDRKTGGDWKEQKKTTYDLAYKYGSAQPHTPVHIGQQAYTYDDNGNQTGWTHDVSGQRRKLLWDEENRLRAVYDNGSMHHYVYDASGERVLKGQSAGQTVFVNGENKAGSGGMGNFIVYVNPYIVLKSGGYTKHYYIEGQRIVSKLGSGFDNNGKGPLKTAGDSINYAGKQEKMFDGIVKNLKFLGADGQVLTAGKSGKVPPGQVKGGGNGNGNGGGGNGGKVSESFQYYYHPDHLGNTSYVTDASGEVYQHLEYFAFGETFVEEHSNTDRVPYLFNGKELDEETGLYYYGARYYDPRTSIWQSADPMMEAAPGLTPYRAFNNNPVYYTDPTGMLEFENYSAYKKYAKENGLKILAAKDMGSQGHWLASDRSDNTGVWQAANVHNLQQQKGYEQYTTISQRADFYGWFQGASSSKGFETKWAGAASEVAHGIDMLTWQAGGLTDLLNYSSPEARDFANTGNRMIFEDVFPKLRSLYNGPALKGQDAYSWDAMALSQEQNLIQPLYENTKAFGLLSAAAKQKLAFSSWVAPVKPFPEKGNLMDVGQRWQYGMQGMGYKVTPAQIPNPGTSYTDHTMYMKFRRAGASGSF